MCDIVDENDGVDRGQVVCSHFTKYKVEDWLTDADVMKMDERYLRDPYLRKVCPPMSQSCILTDVSPTAVQHNCLTDQHLDNSRRLVSTCFTW
jgi:hypothetical protein